MNNGLTSLLFKIIVGLLLATTPCSLSAQQSSEDDSCCVSPEINRQIQFKVTGGVNSPGSFVVQRCVRLKTAIALAGGIIDNGGPGVWIKLHLGDRIVVFPFPFARLSDNEEKTNPFLKSGDEVYVSVTASVKDSSQVYVIGEVFLPQALTLKVPTSGQQQTLTVSLAVAMAGGSLRNADLEKVFVVRQMKDNQKLIIWVNLKLVNKLLAEDLVLQENDIVSVPNKMGKECIFRSSLSSVPYVIR